MAITGEQGELNGLIIDHHKQNHPAAVTIVTDGIMEIGRLRDKIARTKKEVKRLTGYKIPDIQ